MNPILRAVFVYIFLLIVFRISGKRSLSHITTFDFVLLLIIGEAASHSLLGDDYSVTNGAIVIITLVGVDIMISLWKQRSKAVDKLVDSVPMIILENGEPLSERMDKARVGLGDILMKAREMHGLERLDQIKYAVLERNGGISIVPNESQK
jgi:uncharacterized membrane protein YcaP (DUF421 family)